MARQVLHHRGGRRTKARAADATPRSGRETTGDEAVSLRRAILWSAAAFLAVGVVGLLLAPGLLLVWVVLLVFGIAAVPQAFRR